jgi:hypothetical protein
MLDKSALRNPRRMRLPAKILLSLTEASRERLQAEADLRHSTVATLARERILRTFAEDDRRNGDGEARAE